MDSNKIQSGKKVIERVIVKNSKKRRSDQLKIIKDMKNNKNNKSKKAVLKKAYS